MSVTVTIPIKLTPDELAELFADMSGDMQADFFATIGKIASAWPGAGWCQQSYSIASEASAEARDVIRTLASHLPAEDLDWIAAAREVHS